MSFNVNICYNASEDHKMTKSITSILSADGVLREGSSIIDPVITLAADVSSLSGANYAEINSFGRKYFITDIVSIRSGICEVHMHVDVLSTYSSSIKSNKALIYKQENSYNLYLDDGSIKSYSNPRIVTRSFPSGFSGSSYLFAVSG